MHLPCISTDGAAAYTLALYPNPASFDPPILHTIVHCWTSRSYKIRRLNNTAGCGMQAVPLFCKFLCPTLDTAALLVVPLSCVPNTFCPSVNLRFETKLSSALFQSASRSLSTRIPSFCHSSGDIATPSTISLRPSRFLQQRTTTCKTQDPQTGQEHRILGNRTHKTHAAFTRHKDTAQFSKGVFTTKLSR